MNRRAFLGVLGGGLLAAPLAAEAQRAGKIYRVGLLDATGPPASDLLIQGFRRSLRNLGYQEGHNLILEIRVAESLDLLSDRAADLVRLDPDVIVTMGTPATLALKRATDRIPIVTGGVADPVQSGLIQSLSRPGGNVTGHAALTPELTAKQIEILREILPPSSRIVMLGNFFGNPALAPILEDLRQAAGRIGLTVDATDLRDPTGIENALQPMLKNRPAALLLTPDPFVFARHADIGAFALRNRLPAIALWREFASAGGLIAHGPSLSELVQRSTHYVDRILKGAKPGDLPVEQPTRFDLVINLKTAKALGLTIPPSLLQRADQVIE